jgi:hypothetical protein
MDRNTNGYKMIKQILGQTLSFLGKPALYAISSLTDSISKGQTNNLWWSIPISLCSLPLLPFALKGQSLIKEHLDDTFVERTKHLPRISLPTQYAYIEEHPTKGILVQPFHYDQEEEPFATIEEARSFLKALNYSECLSIDCSHNQAFWVPNKLTEV